MVEKTLACTSCKTKLTNMKGSTSFKCPSCGDFDIVRCHHCRGIGSKYICDKCGFSGPN